MFHQMRMRAVGRGNHVAGCSKSAAPRIEALEERRLLSAGAPALRPGHLEGVGGLWGSGVLAVVRGKGLPTAGSGYQVQVNWGDGSAVDTSAVVAPLGRGGAVALTGSHLFAQAGAYNVSVTASVSGAQLGTIHETVRVTGGTPDARVINATAGDMFHGVVGTTPVPPAPGADFRINWNDGSPWSAALKPAGGRYVVANTDYHTLVTPGQFELEVIELVPAADSTSGADSQITLLVAKTDVKAAGPFSEHTIRATPLPQIPLTAGQKTGVPLAELRGLPASLSEATASVHWGDGTPDDSTIVGRDFNGNMQAEIDHTYDRPGVYRAVVTFRNGNQVLGKTTARITVLKNTPGGLDLTAVAGTPFQGVVATLQTISAPQAVMIDWGDGTQSAGTFTAIGNDEYRVSGTHTYTAAGTYRVEVQNELMGVPVSPLTPAALSEPIVGGQDVVFSTMTVSPAAT